MNILINCSNLKNGGGLQVGDSICNCLNEIREHYFVVVLSSAMKNTANNIANYSNVEVVMHDISNNFNTLIFGRDATLDGIVKKNKICAVLTVFGPSRWNPRCKHLCGFARAQLLMIDSPYYKNMSFPILLKEKFIYKIWEFYFKRSSQFFYTENPLTSKMLESLFKGSKVYTVTNYYNQIFDKPALWKNYELSPFDGIRLLLVTSAGKWKNLKIAYQAACILKKQHPNFKFRFVMTITEDLYDVKIEENLKECFEFIGAVPIEVVPTLYKQCDILFQPSLLECFTATYPEAMRMERPIITTNLEFAKGLCGKAAKYYDPIDALSCADAIYDVAKNSELRKDLVFHGKKQLELYDNYNERTKKLIKLLELL